MVQFQDLGILDRDISKDSGVAGPQRFEVNTCDCQPFGRWRIYISNQRYVTNGIDCPHNVYI